MEVWQRGRLRPPVKRFPRARWFKSSRLHHHNAPVRAPQRPHRPRDRANRPRTSVMRRHLDQQLCRRGWRCLLHRRQRLIPNCMRAWPIGSGTCLPSRSAGFDYRRPLHTFRTASSMGRALVSKTRGWVFDSLAVRHRLHRSVAHPVEHPAFNRGVVGSSPTGPTNRPSSPIPSSR